MQSIEKSRVAILVSSYPALRPILVDRVVRYRWKLKNKCDSCQITFFVHGIDLSTETEGNGIVKLNLKKHRLSTLGRISLISALSRSTINVILQDVISGRLSYKVGTCIVIPDLTGSPSQIL